MLSSMRILYILAICICILVVFDYSGATEEQQKQQHGGGRLQKFFMMFSDNSKRRPGQKPQQGYDDAVPGIETDGDGRKSCVDVQAFQDTVQQLKRAAADKDQAVKEKAESAKKLEQLENEIESIRNENQGKIEGLSKAVDAANAARDKATKERDAALSAVQGVQQADSNNVNGQRDAELNEEKKRYTELEREKILLEAELNDLKKQLEEIKSKQDDAHLESRIEEEVFKRIAAQIRTIKAEMNRNWEARLHALEASHDQKKRMLEQQIEMIRIGSKKVAEEKERDAQERYEREVEAIAASHKAELQKMRSELEVLTEDKLMAEAQIKAISESLQKKLGQQKANAEKWEEAFRNRSPLNVTQIVVDAARVVQVFVAPHHATDLFAMYRNSFLPNCLSRAGVIFGRLWEEITSFVAQHLKRECPRGLSALSGQSPQLLADIESMCNHPEQPVGAFVGVTCAVLAFSLGMFLSLLLLCCRSKKVVYFPSTSDVGDAAAAAAANDVPATSANGAKKKIVKKKA